MRVIVLFLSLIRLLFADHQPESISLQLAWLNQFQFAGFYVAQQKGFYGAYDLNVTIKEYQKGHNVVDAVLKGESTYGVGRSSLAIDRSQGRPVVALMALFQHSPSVLITTNPAIMTPKDLNYRMIMITIDEANSIPIMAMLLSHGLQKKDIFLQPHSFSLEDLINHNTDAMACYISNEPFLLNERNITHTIFDPRDYGFDFYGDILFTSEQELLANPERAKHFYSASKQGWEWAFAHIEETAKIIFEHYNTQHKSLEALIYEGKALKKLAYDDNKPFGLIEKEKFETITNLYKISGLLPNGKNLEGFIDPLHFAKDTIRIGILASREGNDVIPTTWRESADYLSSIFPSHHFVIMPLEFDELEQSVKNNEIEFIITNPMQYIQLEHKYGISRLATMSAKYKNHYYSEYGSVIFTRSDAPISSLHDVANKKIGAVAPMSFGGYLLGIKTLGYTPDKNHIIFLGTHYNVIKAVLTKEIDVGIIRTDVLEKMSDAGTLFLNDIRVLGLKDTPQFPFMSSSELYPEWTLAKTSLTSEDLSNEVLSTLLKLSTLSQNKTYAFRLKTPQDYSKVHALLKEFNIYPYEQKSFTFNDVLLKYKYLLIGLLIAFSSAVFFMIHIQTLNRKLLRHAHEIEHFNETLEQEVEERTHALSLLNTKLKELANTDELTKIDNRRHFFLLATQYFYTAKRNKSALHVLSLDIDFFKNVNDTYGHAKGDDILKFFCDQIQQLIRESDLFGRIGGEEFSICIQNDTDEGALIFAEKIRSTIESSTKNKLPELPPITVSIGISGYQESDNDIFDIVKRSDEALYLAKNNGRNQVQIL